MAVGCGLAPTPGKSAQAVRPTAAAAMMTRAGNPLRRCSRVAPMSSCPRLDLTVPYGHSELAEIASSRSKPYGMVREILMTTQLAPSDSPRGDARRRAIIDVARTAFLAQGYAATSM